MIRASDYENVMECSTATAANTRQAGIKSALAKLKLNQMPNPLPPAASTQAALWCTDPGSTRAASFCFKHEINTWGSRIPLDALANYHVISKKLGFKIHNSSWGMFCRVYSATTTQNLNMVLCISGLRPNLQDVLHRSVGRFQFLCKSSSSACYT